MGDSFYRSKDPTNSIKVLKEHTLTLSPQRQSARMSKITNDGLTRSGTRCLMSVPIWQQ